MHIMHMVNVLSAVFFIALFLMCFFRDKLNNPVMNPLFICASAAFFFCWNYAAYELNWLQDGFMTLENISPYICTVILFTPLLNKTVRDYAYCAIAFLGFGMFLAMYISPGAEFLLNFQQNARFIHISEGTCHLIMALYGFYLILSGKVKINSRNFFKALVFIYASIGFGVFLNWCFHLSNFGMNMYGDYSIYFLDIFGSFEATFIAYLLGVFVTILMGYLVGMFLDRISSQKNNEAELLQNVEEQE